MAKNRIEDYFKDENFDRGDDWVPRDGKDVQELVVVASNAISEIFQCMGDPRFAHCAVHKATLMHVVDYNVHTCVAYHQQSGQPFMKLFCCALSCLCGMIMTGQIALRRRA